MSLKEYGKSTGQSTAWVTLGGINRATGKAQPTEVSGYYLGVDSVTSKFSEEPRTVIVLRTDDGNDTKVNAPTVLKSKIARAEKEYREENGVSPLGAYTMIKFIGEEPSKKGNPTKMFTVSFDSDDVNVKLATGAANDTDDAGDYDADYGQAALAAQTDAAARRAKVQELLKSKGRK